ncbi:MAG TPA: hypothetical protein VGI83_10240, partial [Gemmatimonadales bacterium]
TQELDIDLGRAGRPAVRELRTPYDGHQFADYGLLLSGRPRAVVEAKKTSRDARVARNRRSSTRRTFGDQRRRHSAGRD